MPDSSQPANVTVEFQPSGRRASTRVGMTLLDLAREIGLGLLSVCGGAGLCDSCRVRVVRGAVSNPTAHEQDVLDPTDLQAGYRLACQVEIAGDLVVDVPVESIGTEQRLQLESAAAISGTSADEATAAVRAFDVTIDHPKLRDLRSDARRLRDACLAQGGDLRHFSQPVLAQIPETLRALDWNARVVVADDGEAVGLLAKGSQMLAAAVDVGTTKLAVYLVDLVSGRTVAAEGVINPQVTYGEDVVSRIAYADRTPEGAQVLHRVILEAIGEIIARLCTGIGVSTAAVVDAVVVGNTAMHHLACGLPVGQLGRSPYVPAVSGALTLPARDIGLTLAPGARVYLPPNIAGYVGADHVAALLAVGAPGSDRTRLVIDIGTNTEISLFAGDRIVSCSCASGPAFEGAHVSCGMRAVSGAIERVRIIGGALRCQTVGGTPPIGICGSGVLDAVAELAYHGALDRHGGFKRDHPLVSLRGDRPVLVLAPAPTTGHNRELVLTRRDVTEIQLAKAAIRTGIDLLLVRAGMESRAIDEVVVAGAFGSYIDLASARRIGMLPDLPAENFRQVGNAAGAGARQLATSTERRRCSERLAARVEHVDLTTDPLFTETFARTIGFPGHLTRTG